MKKIAMITAAALGVLAACSKTEVKPQQPETPVDDTAPVAVQFGLAAPQSTVSTKASGTVGGITDDTNVWAGQTVYVLGFVRNNPDFAAETVAENAFIWNIDAVANPSDPASNTTLLGVYNPDPDDNPETPDLEDSTEPFYYKDDTVYDFFGYHIDDAWATVTGTGAEAVYEHSDEPVDPTGDGTRVYVPFLIDGTQDLMVAKADNVADTEADTEPPVLNNPDNAYSAYAARRGVQPTLPFEHQLARFTFAVKLGSESARDIKIESIELESRYTGNLVVAGNEEVALGIADTTATDEVNWFALKTRTGNNPGTLEELATFSFNDESATSDTPGINAPEHPLGESILAMPGVAMYNLKVTLSVTDETITTKPEVQELEIYANKLSGAGAGATKFEAGKSYKVTIMVYGLEDVEISASLTPWDDGGSVEIDPDQPPAGNDSDPDAGDDSENTGGTEVTVP